MTVVMRWHKSHRFAPPAVALADRHYSRQQPGTPQFCRPARTLVLLTEDAAALWVTSWHWPEFVKHEWPDVWECTWFRNEAPHRYLSSDLITEAVAATRWYWADPPAHGIITAVDAGKVRRKRDPGRCFRKAGWTRLDRTTAGGLIVYQLLPCDMPEPQPFCGATLRLAL